MNITVAIVVAVVIAVLVTDVIVAVAFAFGLVIVSVNQGFENLPEARLSLGGKIYFTTEKYFEFYSQHCIKRGISLKIKVKFHHHLILLICAMEEPLGEIFGHAKFFCSRTHILGFTGVKNWGVFGVPLTFGWPYLGPKWCYCYKI